ncbi:MAG: hypothetical protein HY002_21045 [Candidatus Rokubacteria bacterium]|nr:hypothetical protein [Candidatus Rokubacteria bacterium]
MNLRALVAALDHPDARALDPDHLAQLRAALPEASAGTAAGQPSLMRGDRPLGVLRPYGSITLYLPGPVPLRHRLLDLDRGRHVTVAIRRGRAAEFREAWVRNVDGASLGILPGDARHPLWGPSDRIARLSRPGGPPEVLTVCGTVDWDGIAAIPPLADPTRLPPGAGTSILNVLASLALDQGAGPLRYRGPYVTEQLFWALAECFRFDPGAPDALQTFLEGAEAAFAAGELREVPLDWTPAPHERLFLEDGLYVQLREGAEKVSWEGRAYYRTDWQGLTRREHRVVRRVTTPDGQARFVASLQALGRLLEDHLVFDERGQLLARPALEAPAPEAHPDVRLPAIWQETLGLLLPLEATPLLQTAIDAVWPSLDIVWGTVPRDLVEVRGRTLRLSGVLARAYVTERAALAARARRGLAHRLVRDVLGLVGPPVRRAAAAWLEAEPPARQQALLEAASAADRRALAAEAATRLGPLLDALAAGEALPDESTVPGQAG